MNLEFRLIAESLRRSPLFNRTARLSQVAARRAGGSILICALSPLGRRIRQKLNDPGM